jgi:hypothetical protein
MPLTTAGQEGEGPPKDTTVPAVVGAEVVVVAEGTLHLRVRSRMRSLSLGRRVVQLDLLEFEVVADGVEGGERLRPLDEDFHVIEPLVQAL